MSWSQYAAGWAVQHGGYDPRRAPPLPRGWHRFGYGAGRLLATVRVRPALVTTVGLMLAAAVPLVADRGATGLLVAAGLVLLSTLASTVARALGVLSGRTSRAGAVRDAAADRLAEIAWLAGFWLAGVPGPLVILCGGLTGLHEYVRSQALAAGMSRLGAQTAAERPGRVVVSVAGLALAGLLGERVAPGLLTVTVTVWLLVTALGLHQLTLALRRSLR